MYLFMTNGAVFGKKVKKTRKQAIQRLSAAETTQSERTNQPMEKVNAQSASNGSPLKTTIVSRSGYQSCHPSVAKLVE
jgi:hypothetical protein